MRRKFWKFHGIGNDFIIFEENIINILNENIIKTICNRYKGIGADGIIILLSSPSSSSLSSSDENNYHIKIYNSDGSIAKICGNGIRCIVKFIYERENINESIRRYNIITDAGIVPTQIVNNKDITIVLDKPLLFPFTQLDITSFQPTSISLKHGNYQFIDISLGNPHAVVIVPDLDEFEQYFPDEGLALSTNQLFPDGVNAEFIQILNESHIKVKVWERGAGPTLACGTGACASTIAGILMGLINRKLECRVTLPGGDLYVRWNENNDLLELRGEAQRVYEGIIDLDSFNS